MSNLQIVVYDLEKQKTQQKIMTEEEEKQHNEFFRKMTEEKEKQEQAKKTALEKLAAIGLTTDDLAALGL